MSELSCVKIRKEKYLARKKYHEAHVICHSCICATKTNGIKYKSKNVTA